MTITKGTAQYQTFDKPLAAAFVHPLDAAGLFSKLFFSWVKPLVAVGNERQLHSQDLWPLQSTNKVAATTVLFRNIMARQGKGVLGLYFSVYWAPFLLIGAMDLFIVAASLYGPGYVLGEIVKIVEAPTGFDSTYALQLILSLFAIQVASAFVSPHLNFLNSNVGMQYAASLRALIFEKAMKLSAKSKTEKSTGEITNLVSTDAVNAIDLGNNIHQFWIVPAQVAFVLFLLYQQVGWSIFVGFGAVFVILIFNGIVAAMMGSQQKKLFELKDTRMKLINELFGSIQIIKFNAWEEKFLEKVSELRRDELDFVWKLGRSLYILITFMSATPTLVTLTVFTTFTLWMRQTLTVSIVFSTLALFKALQEAIIVLPLALSQLIQALVSAKRINDFLLMEERDPTAVLTPTDAIATSYAKEHVVVAIEDGSFGWSRDVATSPPLFQNINLKIRDGEFVVVHGAVGQGKSSLCSILLGDMLKLSGTVFVGGNVAYFAQQPWIQHTSVRENILFGLPYDRVKYQKVVDACALTKDFATFPAGDRAEIGPKGLNLSGGQKARVGLARACYSDADILILDSPLSAVDAIVANEIFTKCFQGLLKHKTVLLVTHNPEIVASPEVDRTILIQDGQLVASDAAPSGVKSTAPPLVAPLRPSKGYWGNNGDVTSVTYAPATREYDMLVTPGTTPFNFHPSEMLFTPRESTANESYDERGRLVVDEERKEGRVSMDVVTNYLNSMGGGWAIIVIVGTMLATQVLKVASDLWLAKWSNEGEMLDAATFEANTHRNMAIYAILTLTSGLSLGVQIFSMGILGIRAAQKMFDGMLRSLLQVPMRFFDTNPLGRVLNRFSDDMLTVDLNLTLTLFMILGELSSIVFTLGTAITLMRWFGLVVVPLLYIYARIGAYYLAPLREVNRLQRTTRSPIISLVSEGVDGAETIRAFGDKQLRRFYRLQDENIETYFSAWFAQTAFNQWFKVRIQLISCSIVCLVLLTIVVLRGELSNGFVGLLVTYALTIPDSLSNLVNIWARLETAMISPERLTEYINLQHEGARQTSADTQTWPTAGNVAFENVSFRYKSDDPLVLKNVNFAVRSGEKIGIVGRTGAGKSSLMMALFRINDVASGAIKIDGVNIATLGLKKLRSNIAIIPQNPVLFKGTLRNYLDPFDEYLDDQLWAVLGKVKLTERVSSADEKLLGPVEENGDNFSVGERQMLCMARALLRQAKIVVLDEATAAIDHETDQTLQSVIRTEFAASTVLTIAHRLDTVLDSDRIMVFDHGELVQCDVPQTLVAQGDGIFFELVTEGGYLDKMQTASEAAE
ncbi:Aste57867_12924 [Aphanomyces stellatus]|uniref:Aste57867_12924 protein n=1 Tax=Aphanomyces stellatus TaxID=120398 RepID=A0A485KWV0_9STRA|nr:hypothetical protein As57867_012876 [Aphanomyces stellatus]VFT89770.1 Aste57867_12924 [Aphanomyces stellatus]